MGVPITYTKEIGDEICLKIATNTLSIRKLCAKNPHWPCFQTIFEWRIKIPSFGEQYAKAKQAQVETLVDECMDIADDSGFDAYVNNEGNIVCDSEAINRARLRVDTRKWFASKLAPKLYGDKQQVDHSHELKNESKEKIRDAKKQY